MQFTVNGERVTVTNVAAITTLLDWLRQSGRTGTKCGCAEGDCGACTVALVERDAHGHSTYRAINSCIALLPMFADREIITVEGIADGEKLHPVQSAMVEHYGSQCGYCTPGFVVSLFEAYYRRDHLPPSQISAQLCGNLCRCTGYRPIRDAALDVLAKRDVRDRFTERLTEPLEDLPQSSYEGPGERFFRPTLLTELFSLLQRYPDATLVAGATEIGVDITKKFKPFPILISLEGVQELTRIVETATEWRIGAAATLTAVEEAVAGEYPSLAKMLSVFASRQIRNRATLGGNLVTASPIGDSAPVLLTLDASVVLASADSERIVALTDFFTGYRQTRLGRDEVLKEIVLPRVAASRADFQKVSHRRELDISIVAGAFRVNLDERGIVKRARIAYGGVTAMPVRARRAEAALEGKTLHEAADVVAEVLQNEFTPIDDVRGSAEYRRGVVVSLWKKFVSGETSLAVDEPPTFTQGATWNAPDPSRQLHHESAIGHVTGRAQYVDDSAQRRPMLDVWPVLASHAHARITRRDATRARQMPGVVAVLMAEDVPGLNNLGVARHDETLFAKDEVMYHGHIVAVVVGESLAACRAAAASVEVEYEALPAILSIKDAIAHDNFHNPLRVISRGNPTEAIANAPHRLSGEFEFGGQEQFYLETQAAWAEIGDEGDVLISSSTQHPTEIQSIVAEVLGITRNKVVVHTPRMGGAFGGKESQGNTPAAVVALAALKTGRPVRVQWDRDLDMILTGRRHPFWSKFDAGFDDDGRLLGLNAELVSDGGWSLDLSQPVIERAMFHIDNAYYIPAVRVSGRVAKTHVASNTAFRGFGGPQGMIVIEEIMDRIARTLRLAPEVVRERNLYHGTGETNRTHYNEDIGDNRIQTMWRRVLEGSRFKERRGELDEWNRAHGRVKRGIAVTPVKFAISFTLTHYNQAGALVHIYQDGTVQVNHGGTEMGQGLHTKILGIVMRELGLPASSIRMMHTRTDKVPNTSATAASAGADLNGAAVRAACITLRERISPVAARMPEASFDQVVKQCYAERISLSSTGFYATPEIHWNRETGSGRPFAYFACGVAVSEVEVDGYSGMTRVRRVDIVHDVGDSLNPGVDRGQIEGGFVQGMGWLTSEELKWDENGRLLTHSASTYQIPAISDAPMEINITLLPHANNPKAVHGSKAVGEPPLMLAFSVREAIRDAVSTFGPPGGLVPLASPATPEAVWRAIEKRSLTTS